MTKSTVEREGTRSEAAKSVESMEAKSTEAKRMTKSTVEREGTRSESKAAVTNKATPAKAASAKVRPAKAVTEATSAAKG